MRFDSESVVSGVLLALLLLVLSVAMGAGAETAGTEIVPSDEGNTIHACVREPKGMVRIVPDGTPCWPGEYALSWDRKGRAPVPAPPGDPVLLPVDLDPQSVSLLIEASRVQGDRAVVAEAADSGVGRPLFGAFDLDADLAADQVLDASADMSVEVVGNRVVIERSLEASSVRPAGSSFLRRHRVFWVLESHFQFTVPHLGGAVTPVLFRATWEDREADPTIGSLEPTVTSEIYGRHVVRPGSGTIMLVAGDVVDWRVHWGVFVDVDEALVIPPVRIVLDVMAVGSAEAAAP